MFSQKFSHLEINQIFFFTDLIFLISSSILMILLGFLLTIKNGINFSKKDIFTLLLRTMYGINIFLYRYPIFLWVFLWFFSFFLISNFFMETISAEHVTFNVYDNDNPINVKSFEKLKDSPNSFQAITGSSVINNYYHPVYEKLHIEVYSTGDFVLVHKKNLEYFYEIHPEILNRNSTCEDAYYINKYLYYDYIFIENFSTDNYNGSYYIIKDKFNNGIFSDVSESESK